MPTYIPVIFLTVDVVSIIYMIETTYISSSCLRFCVPPFVVHD